MVRWDCYDASSQTIEDLLALVLAYIEEIAAEAPLMASSGMSIIISVVFDGFVVGVGPDWGESGDVAEAFPRLAAEQQRQGTTIIASPVLWPPLIEFHRWFRYLRGGQFRTLEVFELKDTHFEFTG